MDATDPDSLVYHLANLKIDILCSLQTALHRHGQGGFILQLWSPCPRVRIKISQKKYKELNL